MTPFFSRALAGSTVPAALPRSPLIIASLLLPLLLSLPTANATCTGDPNNRAVQSSDSPSPKTKSGLPTLLILAIVGAALFFLSMGCIFACLHIRKLRERKKRDDHRKKTEAFRQMQRKDIRPTFMRSNAPLAIPIPPPVYDVAMMSPPYLAHAYAV